MKVPGLSLIEALVVMAIVSLTSAAAFGVLRRPPADLTPTFQEQLANRIAYQRTAAMRLGEIKTMPLHALLPKGNFCSESDMTFYPDGSVNASAVCASVDGQELWFRISPIYGLVSKELP